MVVILSRSTGCGNPAGSIESSQHCEHLAPMDSKADWQLSREHFFYRKSTNPPLGVEVISEFQEFKVFKE